MKTTLSPHQPLASLARRRTIVMIAVAGYLLVLFALLLFMTTRVSHDVIVTLVAIGVLISLVGALPLWRPSRLGLPEGRDATMDERQWQRLSQAHVSAYRLVGGALVLSGAYFVLGFPLPTSHLLPSSHVVGNLVFSALMLIIPILPTAILAWNEPEPD
ncbi:hypothetical protein [Deinococcus alpinitundrae]|uniref:hypothetical protein n=1 Tax=Deinococcus alpinitundrae TaxID=468913 RepID=UPI00137A067F|nr:hypothetical protein [Deinococcus alpinitundrae]